MGHYADSAVEYFQNRPYRKAKKPKRIKMATSYINLIGKARFIKNLFEPDEAFGASRWKAGIWLDEENQEKFYKSGIQAGFQQEEKGGDPTKLKEDEQGPYVTLSRDDMKIINKTPVYFTPPYIKSKNLDYLVSYVDTEGNVVRQYQDVNKRKEISRVGDPFLIGNGSLVELNVCVFDTKTKGKGHRLEGIRILDLIEYKPQPKSEEVAEVQESVTHEETTEVVVQSVTSPKTKKVSPF